MASRQHSGTKLSIRRGKPARRRQHDCCAGGCRYGGMVHAPAAVPALRRIHPVSRRNCPRRWESENTNKWLSKQRVAHAGTRACVEPRRHDHLESKPASDRL